MNKREYETIVMEFSRGLNRALYGTRMPEIKNVIFQEDHDLTVVIWADETKTFVKCDGEDWDFEKGFAVAVAKKALGNKYRSFKTELDKWLHNEKGKKR